MQKVFSDFNLLTTDTGLVSLTVADDINLVAHSGAFSDQEPTL